MNFLWVLPLLFQVSQANELLSAEYSKSAEYEAFLTNRSLWESFDMQNYDYYYQPGKDTDIKDKNITKLGMVWGVLVLIDGVEAFPRQRRGGVWMSIDDLFKKIEKAFETDKFPMLEEIYATETQYQSRGTIYQLGDEDIFYQYNMTVEYDETYGYPSHIRLKKFDKYCGDYDGERRIYCEEVKEVTRASFSLDDFDSSMDENEMEDYSPASKHSILSLAVAMLGVALTCTFA